MNDWGIQNPGIKSDYYVSQRNWVINEISKELGVPTKDIQLDVGIQFGLGSEGQNDVKITKRLLETPAGRSQLIRHLESFGGPFT